jgi:Mn2+/Fe2+ NRAMP family transporter
MLFSNLVMFFIIVTTGAVLYTAGIRQIDTVGQAAKALEPLTGELTYLFFAVGVIGTGFLAIPVLAGSLSYIMAETFTLNMLRFHRILRPNESFHTSPLFPLINLTTYY